MKLSFEAGPPPVGDRPPLRLLILADLHAGAPVQGPTLLRDPTDFGKLLRDLAPHLVLDAENHGGGPSATLRHEARIQSLDDLDPQRMLLQRPELEPARRLLQALEQMPADLDGVLDSILARAPGLGPEVDLCRPATPGAVVSTAAAPAPRTNEPVGRLADLVDLSPSDEERAQRAVSAIGHIVGAVGSRRQKPKTPIPSGVRQAMDLLTARLARQRAALQQHPALQAVEAAWRGLKLLVDRTDFRRGVEMWVMSMARPAVGDALVEQLMQELRADLVLAPWMLDSPTNDGELVQWLGQQAEATQTPALLSLDAAFFGVEASEAAAMRYPGNLFEQPQYIKWNSVRDKPCARWLGAAFNRFLLRSAAGDEPRETVEPSELLWGDPVWLVASLVSRSFQRCGWPTNFTGSHEGRLDDLPIHPVRAPVSGRRIQIPLEALLPHELVNDLAYCGVTAVAGREDTDAGFVLHAPTLFRAPGSVQRIQVSLGYQMLASRIARVLADLKPTPGPDGVPRLQRALEALVEGSGSGSSISVEPAAGGRVAIQVRTGTGVLGGVAVDLELQLD